MTIGESHNIAIATAAADRRQSFVDAAREAFFEHGYAGTAMSSVVTKVGGSKTTLWSYFPSKADLFAAVIDDILDHYANILTLKLDSDEDLAVTLRRVGVALIDMLISDPILSLYRLVVAEAGRFPHLATLYFERGPRRGRAKLAAHLEILMARGTLRTGDPMVAVTQFVGLCQSGTYQLILLNLANGRDKAWIDIDVQAAVEGFVRIWGRE